MIGLLAGAATLLVACGGDDRSATTSPGGPPRQVTVALDWTPNTNHIGAYVADRLGWYREAGLKVRFLPYASTPPETLVSRRKADFAFSYQAGTAYARAAGQDVRQVFANIARNQYAIGVRADDGAIRSPRDLDGRTYAGFGTPDEGPELKWVIRKDGGKGDFRTVTLNTSAYEAVYGGSADFTIPVLTWEGVEARLRGKPMRFFRFSDYGFPEQYSSAIISSDGFLRSQPDVARRFLAATRRGYEYAQANPDAAAKLLVAANRQALKNPELVRDSARMLAADGYYRGADGSIGRIDPGIWERYGSFLYGSGLLTDSGGKRLSAEPDWSAYWTNDYLNGK